MNTLSILLLLVAVTTTVIACLVSFSRRRQAQSREGYWRLMQANGEVVIQWNEDEVTIEVKIVLGEGDYLLFKLGSQDQNQGHHVKSPSFGSYLVMVPDNWERDDTLSGPPQVAPEAVFLTGYQAHFFELEKDGDGKIAFHTPAGDSFVIESKAPQFELVGTRLNDASRDLGPLFGERPPQICALQERVWKDVGTIIVGEEGSGRGRWRILFRPDAKGTHQDLPSEVVDRKGGWYFLRFYDTKDDLIESLDFRFLSNLREIRIPQLSPLPPGGGHKPVQVELLHEYSCVIQPADSPKDIPSERQIDRTILTIPADPTCDKTHWLIGPEGGPQVEATILVERLWWMVAEEDKAPAEWKDNPFPLSRDDFAATSNKAIWLRISSLRWVDAVSVGFEQSKSRRYALKVTDMAIAIPLRDFGDAQELCNIGITPLHLWICSQGNSYTGTICEVIVKVGCKFCDFLASEKEDVISHIESHHLDETFSPLARQEMRERDSSLPLKIYKCEYCDFYVASNDFRNPTSTITSHIERDCAKVPGGAGPVQITFRVICDVDEIRENVIKNLPHIYCSMCGTQLEEAPQSDKMRHLIEQHENRLYELR